MGFRYESDGVEHVARDFAQLQEAVRSGRLAKDAVVLDEAVGVKLKAGALLAMKARQAVAQAPPPAQRPRAVPAPPPKPESDPRRVRRHRVIATVVAILGFFAIAGWAELPPPFISQVTQYIIVALLIVVFVARLLVGGKTDGAKIGLAWTGAVAWMAMWVGASIFGVQARTDSAERSRAAAKAMAQSIRQSADQIEAYGKGEPLPEAKPLELPKGAEASGRGPLIERLMPIHAETQAANARANQEFAAFEESLDLSSIMSSGRLGTAEGRRRNRETIDRYIAGYEQYHQRIVAIQDGYKLKVEKMVEGHPGRERFMAGFAPSVARSRAAYDEALRIQRDVAAHLHRITDYVGQRGQGVQDDRVLFASRADLEGFQEMLRQLEELYAQETALRESQVKRGREAADTLDTLGTKK